MLGLARPVHDAAHDREAQPLNAGVLLTPYRHPVADHILDVTGEFLEHGRGCAAAAGAGSNGRDERADPHRLQQFLRGADFQRPVAIGLRRQRIADRIADPLLKQNANGSRCSHQPLRSHTRFGQAEMQGVGAAVCKHVVDADQILQGRYFCRDDDAISTETQLLRTRSRAQSGLDNGFVQHRTRAFRCRRRGILIHQVGEQFLIEAAPIDADADRLAPLQRHLNDGRKLRIALVLEADVAGIDPILVERLRAGRIFRQQLVADIVEISHDRHLDAHAVQLFADVRHGLRGLVPVNRNAHQLGTRARQCRDLPHSAVDIGRIGIGHRLDNDRVLSANEHAPDVNRRGHSARASQIRHDCSWVSGSAAP